MFSVINPKSVRTKKHKKMFETYVSFVVLSCFLLLYFLGSMLIASILIS